jgi:toxin YoeB
MMRVIFSKNAWEEYLYWVDTDKKILRKINILIKEIQRTPFEGSGKPEALKFDLAGLWSRRIDREHRLVYSIKGGDIIIYNCRYHYD